MCAHSPEEMGMSRKVTVNALDYFSYSEGCFLKKGGLIPAYGAVKVNGSLPPEVNFVSYSPAVQRYFACGGNATYVSGDGVNFVKIYDFGNSAFLVEDYSKGTPRAIVISGNKAAVHYGAHTAAILPVSLFCGVMHCGRLFGADDNDPYLLRWSGTDGFDDWDESLSGSGHLFIGPSGGKIVNIAAFGEKLIVVRKYGITVLSMQSEPEKFSVNFVNTECAEIVDNTACAVMNKLYFFTASGLKAFDGNKISAVPFRHADAVCSPRYAVVGDNKYFVACKEKRSGKDVILCIDSESGESCVFDCPAHSLFIKDGKVFASDFSYLYKITEADAFSFETEEINFGTGRDKTVVGAFVEGECDVKISNGKCVRKFVSASGIIKPKMRGKSFKVKVYGKCGIPKIELTAEVLDAI